MMESLLRVCNEILKVIRLRQCLAFVVVKPRKHESWGGEVTFKTETRKLISKSEQSANEMTM